MSRKSLLAMFAAIALGTLYACTPSTPRYVRQHQQDVAALISAWNDGTVDALDAVVAPDFHRISPGGLNIVGLDALKQLVLQLRSSYPDMHVTLEENHFMQDVSFHLWTFTGTNAGPGELPATGKHVTFPGATLIRYRDGKISEEIVFTDVLDWRTQLGYRLAAPDDAAVAAPPVRQGQVPVPRAKAGETTNRSG